MNYLDLPHQLAVAEDCGRLAADGRNDGAIERLTSGERAGRTQRRRLTGSLG